MDERVCIASAGDFHLYQEGCPPQYRVCIVSRCFECFGSEQEARTVMQGLVQDVGLSMDDEPPIQRLK